MAKIYCCRRCGGTGEVRKIDWFIGALTLGITVLMDLSMTDWRRAVAAGGLG